MRLISCFQFDAKQREWRPCVRMIGAQSETNKNNILF